MARLSTSFHCLNGDQSLHLPGRGLYFALNKIQNLLPLPGLDDRLRAAHFQCRLDDGSWEKLPQASSPARKLSDLFWMHLPWPRVAAALKELHVHDMGCGAGGYAARLQKWCGNKIQYHGFDVRRRPGWDGLDQSNDNFSASVFDGLNFAETISRDHNFFMSQSALEHIPNDLAYFTALRDHIAERRRPALQVHLAPSPPCLKLYRQHGIRQYTPRSISKITRLFDDASRFTLFQLGGPRCNDLHYRFFTRPAMAGRKDKARDHAAEYDDLLREAVEADMRRPSRRPSFYALVIESYCPGPLLSAA